MIINYSALDELAEPSGWKKIRLDLRKLGSKHRHRMRQKDTETWALDDKEANLY